MRCEDLATDLSAVADGSALLARDQRRHVERCLRCQAELVQYRKLLRAMRTMRTEVLEPAPGMLADILANVAGAGERRAVRSLIAGTERPTSGAWRPPPRPGRPGRSCSPAGPARSAPPADRPPTTLHTVGRARPRSGGTDGGDPGIDRRGHAGLAGRGHRLRRRRRSASSRSARASASAAPCTGSTSTAARGAPTSVVMKLPALDEAAVFTSTVLSACTCARSRSSTSSPASRPIRVPACHHAAVDDRQPVRRRDGGPRRAPGRRPARGHVPRRRRARRRRARPLARHLVGQGRRAGRGRGHPQPGRPDLPGRRADGVRRGLGQDPRRPASTSPASIRAVRDGFNAAIPRLLADLAQAPDDDDPRRLPGRQPRVRRRRCRRGVRLPADRHRQRQLRPRLLRDPEPRASTWRRATSGACSTGGPRAWWPPACPRPTSVGCGRTTARRRCSASSTRSWRAAGMDLDDPRQRELVECMLRRFDRAVGRARPRRAPVTGRYCLADSAGPDLRWATRNQRNPQGQ